jgi:antitoxin Phd
MHNEWQLQEAKNKFSEVVNRAQSSGPQAITKHGKKTAVVLSFQNYQRIKKRQGGDLVEFFRRSPITGMDFKRTRDFPREVRL